MNTALVLVDIIYRCINIDFFENKSQKSIYLLST